MIVESCHEDVRQRGISQKKRYHLKTNYSNKKLVWQIIFSYFLNLNQFFNFFRSAYLLKNFAYKLLFFYKNELQAQRILTKDDFEWKRLEDLHFRMKIVQENFNFF